MISNILIKPVISEYSLKDAARGVYTFRVSKTANKTEIKHAVEKQFNVKVVKIATAIIKDSRNVRSRTTIKAVQEPYKKARVTLTKGQKIAVFEEKKD